MDMFPDAFFLAKISEQNLYCDEFSLEKGTEKIKRKFKLAGVQALKSIDIYTFFVTTSKGYICRGLLTLTVKPNDWEDIQGKYIKQLKGKNCYIDIQKIETLSKDELLIKLKDKKNQFIYAAKLSEKKFKELKKLPFNLSRLHQPLSTIKTNNIVNGLIGDSKESENLLKTLGL
jgi:hypothetical protein